MKLGKNLGMKVLAIYLIVAGALPLLKISFAYSDLILPILAIVAGVLLLMGR